VRRLADLFCSRRGLAFLYGSRLPGQGRLFDCGPASWPGAGGLPGARHLGGSAHLARHWRAKRKEQVRALE
jgi:hypothetical protein